MTPSTTIEEFKPFLKNSLIGFVRVRMPSGVIYHDVSIHKQGDFRVGQPDRKAADRPRRDAHQEGGQTSVFAGRVILIEGGARQILGRDP